MSVLLVLAVLIVLVSGLIAYVGDLVGRKMGRKRLTLFGLRPRYTAIVISVGMGMLIAALTLTITFAVSQAVREAFFTPIGTLKSEKQRLEAKVAQMGTQEAQSKAQYQAAHHELTRVQNNLDSSRRQREQIQQQLSRAQAEYTTATKQLQDTQQRLQRERDNYTRVHSKLTASTASLERSNAALVNVSRQLQSLTERRMALEGEIQSLRGQMLAVSLLAETSFSELAFTSGQELISGLFPTGGSIARRKDLLRAFIATAKKVVRQRAVQLPEQEEALLFFSGSGEHFHVTNDDAAISELSERIARETSCDQVILRLAPMNNVPINGPALIVLNKIELIPNLAAYRAGDEVARTTMEITAKTTTADILGAVVDGLLRNEVPDALRGKKVVMVTRRFSPDKTDAPRAVATQIPWGDLVDIADHALALRGKVFIIARSRKAITRFGPLELDFDVKSAP